MNKAEAIEYLEKCLNILKENGIVSFLENRSDILEMSINALKEQIEKSNQDLKKDFNAFDLNDKEKILNIFVELKEKAINQVKETETIFPFMKSNFRKDVIIYKTAISALKEQIEREKNKPLTFEELLEKENEPVWVEHCHGGEWVIVCWDYVDRIAYSRNACLHQHDYGKAWIAYKYKISEEERCARYR